MAKTKRRRAEQNAGRTPTVEEASGHQPPLMEPLPPPKRNEPLLLVLAALVTAWIAALVYLVLWG